MEVSIEELKAIQRDAYAQQRARFLPILLEYRRAGNWQEFIATALCIYEVMPDAFLYYEEIPDDLKYDFAVSAYLHHGDSIPAVREAVKGARKYGEPQLPRELAKLEAITIYRAGEENIEECHYRLSWTADHNTALFFLNTYQGRHANYLYKGLIKPADVIAYTNARKESEIIQYDKVFNVELLETA